MNNKFENFFNDPTKALQDPKFRPSLNAKIESLMAMTGKFPNWHSQQPLRLIVASLAHECNCEFERHIDNGTKPDIHVFAGAFMMLLNDILGMTADNACEEEQKMYNYNIDEDEEDQEDFS
jgi:hypothetical protein